MACFEVGDTESAKGERAMSEAGGRGGLSRAEFERRLIIRSMEEDFLQKLLDDPKGTLEQELGTRLPEAVRVMAVEETQDTIYLVLPFSSPVDGEGGELSDEALESVAGGQDDSVSNCSYNICPSSLSQDCNP
jgi:hypothetical protein